MVGRQPLRGRCERGKGLVLPSVFGALLAAPGVLSEGRQPAVAVLLIAPLLACVRLDAWCTAGVAVLAGLLALGIGVARDLMLTPSFAVECGVLVTSGAIAVRIAARDVAHAAALARVTEVARVAQAAVLRPVSARIGGVDVCTRHHCPTREATVGGDVYDIVQTPYGPRLLIGDVRGHGLDAVRTSAMIVGAFRDLAYTTPELLGLVRELDAAITPELGTEDFVTALFAEFAPGEVRLVNCGHPPPLRVGNQLKTLEPPDFTRPLGLAPEPSQLRCWLQAGDRILFYTDGLTEARDAGGAEFPLLERAGDALSAVLPGDALDALYEEVTAHTGGPLCDDVALILCEQTEAALPGAVADASWERVVGLCRDEL